MAAVPLSAGASAGSGVATAGAGASTGVTSVGTKTSLALPNVDWSWLTSDCVFVTTAAEPAPSMPNIPSPISALLAIFRAYGGDIQGRGGEDPRNGKDLAKVGALEG